MNYSDTVQYIIKLTGLLSPSKGVVTGSMGGVTNDSGVGFPSGPVEWAGPEMEWTGPERDCPWRRFLCVPTCSRTVRITFFLSSSLRIPDLI